MFGSSQALPKSIGGTPAFDLKRTLRLHCLVVSHMGVFAQTPSFARGPPPPMFLKVF